MQIVRRVATLAIAAVLWAAAMPPGMAQENGVRPARVVDGIAPVGPGNSRVDPETGMLRVEIEPDPRRAGQPAVKAKHMDEPAKLLRGLVSSRRAAGMHAMLYDNRDRSHSTMKPDRFPQLNRLQYADVFQRRGLDYGVAGALEFSLPTVGNSSTAQTKGPFFRSQARVAVMGQAAAERAYRLYMHNHLYVYPEHRDHDPKNGDLSLPTRRSSSCRRGPPVPTSPSSRRR